MPIPHSVCRRAFGTKPAAHLSVGFIGQDRAILPDHLNLTPFHVGLKEPHLDRLAVRPSCIYYTLIALNCDDIPRATPMPTRSGARATGPDNALTTYRSTAYHKDPTGGTSDAAWPSTRTNATAPSARNAVNVHRPHTSPTDHSTPWLRMRPHRLGQGSKCSFIGTVVLVV